VDHENNNVADDGDRRSFILDGHLRSINTRSALMSPEATNAMELRDQGHHALLLPLSLK
jgi:hypothetical protein